MNLGVVYRESYEYERLRCKVGFYNSCGILKKLLLVLIHGRNFVPTENEKYLIKQFAKQEKKE